MLRFCSLLLLAAGAHAALVPDVRALLNKGDFPAAEKLINDFQKQNGTTPEMLEAQSWLGRGALAAKKYAQADTYAAGTRRRVMEVLKTRKLDAEPRLPIALGATIEVQGQALAAMGKREAALAFLKKELAQWKDTSMRARIQKNIHLLSLAGQPPPPLETKEWLGPKPPALAALKGKPVLLFFWAHWCADCKYQGPILAQLRDRYASKGLRIVAPTQYYGYVAGGEDAPPAQEKPYMQKIRAEFYPGLGEVSAPISVETFQAYGVSTTPTLVLLDKAGMVKMYHPGRMTYEELASEIDKVL